MAVTTSTEIVNLGLDLIGEARIIDIAAPTNERGKIANTNYGVCRDALLRRYDWVFARKWFLLYAETETTLDVDRPYAYQLPAEVVRVLRPKLSDWQIVGRFIHTAVPSSIKVLALRNDMPPGDMDPLFVQALAASVALRLVERKTQSANKQALLRDHYKEAVAEAVMTNAIEKKPEDAMQDLDSQYLLAYGGYTD